MRRSHRAAWWLVRLLATREGARCFMRVYSYFRWADDVVDAPGRDAGAVRAFARDQRAWVEAALAGAAAPEGLPQAALYEVIQRHRGDPLLASSLRTMWAALDFDARRGGAPITREDLEAQIRRVGDAFTDALLFAAGAGPAPEGLRALARAATAVHHLRDLELDLALGYLNVPAEDARRFGFSPWSFTAAEATPYVRARREGVRADFRRGGAALGGLRGWRARLLFRAFAWRYARALERLAPTAPAPAMARQGATP